MHEDDKYMISFDKILKRTSLKHDDVHIKIAKDVVNDFLESDDGKTFQKEFEEPLHPDNSEKND